MFVNSKSGGNQGKVLISQLRRVLNPIQVWDLAKGGPERILKTFSKVSEMGGANATSELMHIIY